jgi:hypothetical protein
LAPPIKRGRAKSSKTGGLIRKLRKPMAPPMRVAEDERKYRRARERERLRRETGAP